MYVELEDAGKAAALAQAAADGAIAVGERVLRGKLLSTYFREQEAAAAALATTGAHDGVFGSGQASDSAGDRVQDAQGEAGSPDKETESLGPTKDDGYGEDQGPRVSAKEEDGEGGRTGQGH